MTALIAFLMTASFWFWALVILLNIGILRWIEIASVAEDDSDSPVWATVSVVATLVILQICGIPIWQYAAAHPLHIVYGLLGYLATGTIWATTRWYLYTRDQFHKYEGLKTKFLVDNGILGNSIPETLKSKFASAAVYWHLDFRPQVTENKSRIYMWMCYWPWSMLWTVINRPIKKAFDFIYSEIRALLQKISDHTWAGTENDLPPDK